MSSRISFYVWVFYPEKNQPAEDKVEAMAEAIRQFMTREAVERFTVEHSLKVSDDGQPFVAFEVKTDLDFASDIDCDVASNISQRLRLQAYDLTQEIFGLSDLNAFWSRYDAAEPVAA